MEEKQIPSLELNDNRVVLPTIEVPLRLGRQIEKDGKMETIFEDCKVILQKLAAGKRRDIAKVHFQTKVVGNQMQSNPDIASFQIAMLTAVIIEAPFPIDEKTISGFPDNVVDYLYEEYDSWANENKKKD